MQSYLVCGCFLDLEVHDRVIIEIILCETYNFERMKVKSNEVPECGASWFSKEEECIVHNTYI